MDYQAIIIGGGMTGSWIAKELCDAGVKTLMLERGREVNHQQDYPTMFKFPWDLENANRVDADIREANPVISKCYAFREATQQNFVKDTEHPYVQEKPFDWIRGYQTGGRSLMWARQVQRWSDYDFDGPRRDEFAVDWPIRYADLEKWYDYVEEFIGVTGEYDGLDAVPDGKFLKSLGMNCVEDYMKQVITENYKDRHLIYARAAHLTEVKEIHKKQARGQCQNRLLCERGCPYGGYFSANASTIPWAKRTGNLTIRPHSVVHSIVYDEETGKASGVRVIDANTKEEIVYNAPYVFVNAGTLNTNLVLLNSKSERFPNGLGNDNGLLGKYVAFHIYRAKMLAECPKFDDKAIEGRQLVGGYIPRFRNLYESDQDFKRGYAISISASRPFRPDADGLMGQELVDAYLKPKQYGPWSIYAGMMGETIPKESNYVNLHPTEKDAWGIPQLNISIDYDDNDLAMVEDFYEQMEDIFNKAGFTNLRRIDSEQAPGLDIHEMGGVRMGRDPETSMLDKWHRMHLCQNVIVTDGSCMTSVATQNPSLTFMAMAARAANNVIEEMKGEGLL